MLHIYRLHHHTITRMQEGTFWQLFYSIYDNEVYVIHDCVLLHG